MTDDQTDDYWFWGTQDLIERGIFADSNEIYRARKFHNFPAPVKVGGTMQSRARYRVSEVRQWLDNLARHPNNQSYRKDDPAPPRRRTGRPRKHQPESVVEG